MKEFVYGLDFGTSKTVLSRAKCDGPRPEVNPVKLDGSETKVVSCLLYDQARDEVVAIGKEALEEYDLQADEETRKSCQLFSNFKPHIHQDKAHERSAMLFLTRLAQTPAVAEEFAQYGDVADLIVGRPANWPVKAEQKILSILRDAGYPNPKCLPEPTGALFQHLAHRLRAAHLHRDLLLIDWGAGTLDFTLMRQGKVVEGPEGSWGSNLLGGRLFDDVFCQIIRDTVIANGDHAADLEAVDAYPPFRNYLATLVSKEVKEHFSDRLNSGRMTWPYQFRRPIDVYVHSLGRIKIETFEDFESRITRYRPSALALGWMQRSQQEATAVDEPYVKAMLAGEPIDLTAWARDAIRHAVRHFRLAPDAIAILTGGSTKWLWFQEIVKETEPFDGERVLIDDDPEVTISKGLCRAYAISASAATALQSLTANQDLILRVLDEHFYTPWTLKIAQGTAAVVLDARGGLIRQHLLVLARGKANEVAVRSGIDQTVSAYLSGEGGVHLNAFSREFRENADAEIPNLVSQCGARIEGPLQSAFVVFSPSGGVDLADGLRGVAGSVRINPSWFDQLTKALRGLWEWVTGKKLTPAEIETRAQQEAERMFARFCQEFPGDIYRAIQGLQSSEDWCRQVWKHLATTLKTIVDLAEGERE